MKLNQAYEVLGIPRSSSKEEAKSAYKKKAFELHPDRNPDPSAPEKLKELNEAYELIKNPPRASPFRRSDVVNDVVDFDLSDLFNNMGFGFNHSGPQRTILPPIQLSHTISFIDSVLGVEHTLNYRRLFKCQVCDGAGYSKPNNGCPDCKGLGRITVQQHNMIFTQTCPKCKGNNLKSEPCNSCHGKGGEEKEISLNVKIPSGLRDTSTLRLQHAGHFMESGPFGDTYGEVHFQVTVEPHPVLSLHEINVICPLSLTLLEALEGCQKTVPSVKGEQTVTIPPKSRHREEIELPGLGVAQTPGKQKVILEVQYPDDISTILSALQPIKESENVSN